MKNQTSSMDVHFLVKELARLEGAKVNKIFQGKKDFLFDLHKTGVGRVQLRIVIPDFIFTTKYKPQIDFEVNTL